MPTPNTGIAALLSNFGNILFLLAPVMSGSFSSSYEASSLESKYGVSFPPPTSSSFGT
uniref:Uncharacterized protein n=1 Tax=Arundo donax TaxID=35708 RepID=A0A0A9AQ76_ARUDO